MIKHGFINKRGFSLIELSIGMLILSILVSAVVPNFVRGIRQDAAKKTAVEISEIQEAARKYYVDKGSWPADFPTLSAAGYLDPTWSATNLNPFSNPYQISLSTPNLNVITNIPTDVYLVTGANLQMVTYTPVTGGLLETVQSTVTPPGSLTILPAGSIIPWPSSTLPTGFLWCNGQNVSRTTYSGLFAVIGTIYGVGDGSTTFGLPDMRGRTIVGQDAMGGSSAANRITQWGALPATLGGTFGEDAHRQAQSEMAPHQHANGYGEAFNNLAPFGVAAQYGNHNYGSSGTDQDNWEWNTDVKGGNGDGSGLGVPSNVVQPSIAMGYIIKY
jgi:prepilin-type N-terminal cleavage/methylation domain-containing protein